MSSDARTPTLKSTFIQYHFLNCVHLRAKAKKGSRAFVNNPASVYRGFLSGAVQEIKIKFHLFCLGLKEEKGLRLTKAGGLIVNMTF